jgi:ornithine cyclodeaminase/alanine dehydrogenase-like protein (mu-crystallin family)
VLILSAADVRELVPMGEAIRLMGIAFAELSAGRAHSPLRTPIPDAERGGVSLFMPAAVPALGGLGLKVVSVYPTNAARGLPTILAIVALLDAETGQPLAILDGTFLTALRTGAVSGKATELLARPDARTLLCIGAGAQAFTQVWAACTARPGIERILITSRTRARAEGLVARLRDELPELGARASVVDDLHAATAQADVICAATSATMPVFDDADLRPGTHINAVGAYTHAMQEVPAATVVRARVVVDAVEAALAEAGDLVRPLEAGLVDRAHLETELGQVVAGTRPGRTSPDQITLFKSVGNAVQDIAVARFAVERAEATGRGQRAAL